MARKKATHRPNLPQEVLDRARQEAAGVSPSASAATRKPAQAGAATSTKTTVEDLAHEYAYVINDLRNMFALAAALFVALIALALVL